MRPSSTARIMLVTQHLIIGADLIVQMRKLGYDVIGICSSTKQAMKLVAIHLPDIVMIDLTTKGEMDGIQLGQRIRLESGIKVFFLNPGMGEDTMVRAYHVKPEAILSVPYLSLQLFYDIEAAMHINSSGQSYNDEVRSHSKLYIT